MPFFVCLTLLHTHCFSQDNMLMIFLSTMSFEQDPIKALRGSSQSNLSPPPPLPTTIINKLEAQHILHSPRLQNLAQRFVQTRRFFRYLNHGQLLKYG